MSEIVLQLIATSEVKGRMADTTSIHRGHNILQDRNAEAPRLLIDGETVPVSQVAEDEFATLLLPYSNFPSLDALARAVIDHSPQFNGRRDTT